MENYDRKSLKKYAKKVFLQNFPVILIMALLVATVQQLLSYVLNAATMQGSFSSIASIIAMLIVSPILMGQFAMYHRMCMGERKTLGDFFHWIGSGQNIMWAIKCDLVILFKIFLRILLPLVLFMVLVAFIPAETDILIQMAIIYVFFIAIVLYTLPYSSSIFYCAMNVNDSASDTVKEGKGIVSANFKRFLVLWISFLPASILMFAPAAIIAYVAPDILENYNGLVTWVCTYFASLILPYITISTCLFFQQAKSGEKITDHYENL